MADYSTTASVVLTLNGQQAKKMLADLQKQSEELGKKIHDATEAGDTKALKKYKAELKNVERMMDQIKNSGQKVDAVLQRLDKATPKELNKALVELKRQLNGIERGSKAWDEQIEKIKQVKKELKEMNAEMTPEESLWDKFKAWFDNWEMALAGAAATVAGLVAVAKKAVSDFAEMEQEMANVRKYTGMTAEEVEILNEEFKKMDTRTSREDLNKLAQEAGRLGKQSVEDVLGFVRAADKINVALDDLGEGATLTLSKLTGIFGDEKRLGTEKALLSVGSVINELSQNCAASAPYLTEFASRMGGVGAQAGMTVQQIMAFAAVLDSNNQKVEKSATALSQIIVRLYQDPAKYAAVAGMDVKRFSELVKNDMNGALIEFLSTLKSAGKMDVLSPMFKEMGESGSGAIAALSTLTDHIQELKDQQFVANEAFREATSIGIEFDVQNQTIQAGLDKGRKSFHELTVQLGQKLQPVISHIISSTRLMYEGVSILVDFLIDYGKELAVVVAAIFSYRLALAKATVETKLHAAAVAASSVAHAAWRSAVLLARAAVALLTGNLTKAREAMLLLNQTIKMNPLGLLLASITAVIGALALFAKRSDDARKAQMEAREEFEKWKKSLSEVSKEMDRESAHQISVLEDLYRAATDEMAATEGRRKAAQRLIDQYPDYFRNMDTEQVMLGNAKSAYNSLRDSILEAARAKAVMEKIQDNESQKLSLELQRDDVGRSLKTAKTRLAGSEFSLNSKARGIREAGTLDGLDDFRKINKAVEQQRKEVDKLEAEYSELNEKIVTINEENKKLKDKVRDDDGDMADGGIPGMGEGAHSGSKDRFAAEREWRERAEAEARIAYRMGEDNYMEYTRKMDEIAEEFYQRQLAHTDLSETERMKITADFLDARAKSEEDWQKATIDGEDVAYNSRIASLKQFYIDGKISKEAYDIKMEELEIGHQRRLVEITEEGSQERIQAEKRLQDLLMAQMQKRQQEVERVEKQIESAIARTKDAYFGLNESERRQAYNDEEALILAVYDREVVAAQGNAQELARIEEAKQLAILAIKRKYGLIGEEEYRNSFEKAISKSAEWLKSEGGQALTGTLSTLVSGMSSVFSQLSSYIQAELEIQTAAIEKRYDAELSRAEGNSYKIKKLEEQKEKELAELKNEANRKMFAMQVIQAVAQTAQNALNAYGSAAQVPVVGYILAPIAAAMAVAAGAIQVASIKKQQQAAAAQGYSEGGFTPKGDKDKPVGVVHAGEWVASQKLVNDPRTRPLIEALEYAQRTNTIGSISSRDVSRSITAPMVLAHGGSVSQPNVIVNVPENSSSNQELNNALDKLNKRLDEPFVTINTVTGDYGSEQAKAKYDRLLKNKSPKYKR